MTKQLCGVNALNVKWQRNVFFSGERHLKSDKYTCRLYSKTWEFLGGLISHVHLYVMNRHKD